MNIFVSIIVLLVFMSNICESECQLQNSGLHNYPQLFNEQPNLQQTATTNVQILVPQERNQIQNQPQEQIRMRKFLLALMKLEFLKKLFSLSKRNKPSQVTKSIQAPRANSVTVTRNYRVRSRGSSTGGGASNPAPASRSADMLLLTIEQLATYNGAPGASGLYIAVFGKIHDAGMTNKYYAYPDGSYAFLAGTELGPGFVLRSVDVDNFDVNNLTTQQRNSLILTDTYFDKYPHIGYVISSGYYDASGQPTELKRQIEAIFATG